MGGASSTPLALDELTQPYIQSPRLTRELYVKHVADEAVDQEEELLHHVPADLLGKVSLHRSLDLSFNLIAEIPPDLPLNLPHLTVLNLSHNKITRIPDSLFGFIHLRLLDLSFNKIENVPSFISLFPDLRKLDLSHNEISKIPSSINNLKKLEKLNLSHNNISHLPLSLGNVESLQVLIARDNPLQLDIEEASSDQLLAYLRRCYTGSVAVLPPDHISLGNSWTRTRGAVFDSSVLNSGSAQSLFEQMQAQAVNTGNRLLTPLIPPVKATSMPVDKLRDSILGIFYGAAIGDSLGLLTEGMSPDEAEFHYSRRLLDQSHLYRDERRSEAEVGGVSPGLLLSLAMLESVMTWAGVVDELDYAARLVTWHEEHGDNITSEVIDSLMKNKEAFLKSPATMSKAFYENNEEHFDNLCLPSMIAIAVTQFHNLTEVKDNARRICSSTHFDEKHINTSVRFAEIIATILKGDDNIENVLSIPKSSENMDSVEICLAHLPVALQAGFREALTEVVMKGGDATINGLVSGAVFGAMHGHRSLPPSWISNINKAFIQNLNKKINLLFDLMGVP